MQEACSSEALMHVPPFSSLDIIIVHLVANFGNARHCAFESRPVKQVFKAVVNKRRSSKTRENSNALDLRARLFRKVGQGLRSTPSYGSGLV